MKILIYLASPYNDASEEIRDRRFVQAIRATAALMRSGLLVYSPIAHNHPILRECELSPGYEHWKEFDEMMIRRSDEVWVLMLPGWRESSGIKSELEFAKAEGKPIHCIYEVEGQYSIVRPVATVEAER